MLGTMTKEELENDIKRNRIWIIWGWIFSVFLFIAGILLDNLGIFQVSIIAFIITIGFKIEQSTSILRYELKGGDNRKK